MKLHVQTESWPLSQPFGISRGTRTEAEVIVAILTPGNAPALSPLQGWGEATPYSRYGESLEGCRELLNTAATAIEEGVAIPEVIATLPHGAARNALDCAWWDWRCKEEGVAIETLLGLPPTPLLVTAYTIGLDGVEAMEALARRHAHRPLLKIKTGGEGVVERVKAIRQAAPKSQLIVDANEAWPARAVGRWLEELAALGVAMVEQPLPAGKDDLLADLARPIPIFADESFHTRADLDRCRTLYDGVNLKLDKTGGLTEALAALEEAKAVGLRIMCGCMLGTSLAMLPAMQIARQAEFVDLDAPLLLAYDRPGGLIYGRDSSVAVSSGTLWGAPPPDLP